MAKKKAEQKKALLTEIMRELGSKGGKKAAERLGSAGLSERGKKAVAAREAKRKSLQ